MREMHDLLAYIDEYLYVKEYEEIVIRNGGRASEAKKRYDKVVNIVRMETKQTPKAEGSSSILGLEEERNDKWILDIAISCVQGMKKEDISYILNNMNVNEYYNGYTMRVRKEYIHAARIHSHLEEDELTRSVMKMIFSILSPTYDYRDDSNECSQEVSIEELYALGDISLRTHHCLIRANVYSLGDLCKLTSEEVMKIRNLGRKGILEILAVIEKYGLSLNPVK